jgi:hypothetical protein
VKRKMSRLIRKLEKDGFRVLRVDDWHTFDYHEAKCGNVELKKEKYRRGLYLMEGVDGYDFFYVAKPITVNVLKVDGEDTMLDDPLHYHGMRLLAEASSGRVLTAGLGLGLYTIFLQQNPKVSSVTVVELNRDVRNLIYPMIEKYIAKPTEIVIDDIMNWVKKARDFDTIMLDIWVTNKQNRKIYYEMERLWKRFTNANPNAKVYVWGIRSPQINPAVKRVSLKYLEFIRFIRGRM